MEDSIQDARPGDVFVDSDGQIYRVKARFNEPVIELAMIDPVYPSSIAGNDLPPTMRGTIHAQMWDGFKRIYRPD